MCKLFFLFVISWEGKSPLLNVKHVDPWAGVASTVPGRWLANLYFTLFHHPPKTRLLEFLAVFLSYQFRITMYMSSNKPRHCDDSNIYDHLWIFEQLNLKTDHFHPFFTQHSLLFPTSNFSNFPCKLRFFWCFRLLPPWWWVWRWVDPTFGSGSTSANNDGIAKDA